MTCATRWYDDPVTLRCLPPLFRLLAAYYRHCADPFTGDAPRGRHWHYHAARAIQFLRLKDTALVRLRDVLVDIDLLDARATWVMDELLQPTAEGRVLRGLLGPDDTFLDVGANHGSYSLIAAPVVNQGRVIAFEPQPRLAGLLRQSFHANAFRRAEVMEVACADRNGEATLYVPRSMSGMGGLYEGFSGGKTRRRMTVRLRRLDDLLDGSDLPGRVAMKLDVEGSELAALHGARSLVRDRLPLILLEINPTSASAAGYTVADLLGFLGDNGYDRFAEPGCFPAGAPLTCADTRTQRNVFVLPRRRAGAQHWDL